MSFLQSRGPAWRRLDHERLMRGFGGAHLRAMSQHACNFDQLVASAAVLAHSTEKGGAVDHGTEVLKSQLPWCISPCLMAISWLLSLADVLAYHVSIILFQVLGTWHICFYHLSMVIWGKVIFVLPALMWWCSCSQRKYMSEDDSMPTPNRKERGPNPSQRSVVHPSHLAVGSVWKLP